MSVSVELITGPVAQGMSRQAAEEGLKKHAAIAAGAPYALEQVNGRWVAAVVHQAEFPPAGSPADDTNEVPGPAGESPDDSTPSDDAPAGPDAPDDGGPDDSPDSDGPDGPPKKEKGDSKNGELKKLLDAVDAIAQALGIPLPSAGDEAGLSPDGPDAGPDGGLGDGGAPVPPPAGPGGPDGAPAGPPTGAPGHGDVQRVIHEKALKPGEVPPGSTPVGAPAFSSVRVNPNHPWAKQAGVLASFHVASPIGDAPLTEVESELRSLASEIGYRVARLGEGRDERGQRIASAVITAH